MLDNNDFNTLKEINKIYTHKHMLSYYMGLIVKELLDRSIDHDNSKLTPEELDGYVKNGAILDNAVIGTQEYNDTLELMKKYNNIHYNRNRHHPEHFSNGIDDMNLIDIIEMFSDWCSVSDIKNTDVLEVMENVLFKRFDIDEQLCNVIKNTIIYLRNSNLESTKNGI